MRLEAEFYIAASHTKSSFVSGEDATDFVQYGTSEELNEKEQGYPILRLNEFESWFIGRPTKYCDKIDRQTYESLKLKAGDVLICRTNGNPKLVGKTAIVMKDVNYAFASYLFRVRPELSVINSETLMVYLNSKIGRAEIEKYSMVSNQANFSPAKFREIQIPVLSTEIQSRILELVTVAYQTLEQSKALYAEAESLLLDELGLRDWRPTDENVAVKSFAASFGRTGRLDAEYYQPKYDQALARLRKLKPKAILPLESLLTLITNGHTPLHHDLSIGEIPFLTAEHVSDFRINFNSDKRILREHHQSELKRTRLQEGDILITIKGRVGNAAVVEHLPGPTNINQDVALLRLVSGVHPYYVIGYLNSVIGRTFINQICTGQINPFLGLGNLRTVSIPIFDQEQMQSIGQRLQQIINQAYETAQSSKRLLDIAKRGVEIAIEQDEATALKWLEQQSATGLLG